MLNFIFNERIGKVRQIMEKIQNKGKADSCHTSFIFLFHSDYYHCFVVFFSFSLFYFRLVCAVVIMGSQHQMSLALPCRAL